MSKRRNTKTQKESIFLTYIAWFLALIAFSLLALVGGYYLGFENAKTQFTAKEKKKQERRLELLKKIEETNVPIVDNFNARLKKVLKEEVKVPKAETKELAKISKQLKKEVLKVREYSGASHEYAPDKKLKAPERAKRKIKVIHRNKPRLAIIIDDVSVLSHVKAIKSLGYDLTMSFLPPSVARPNSAKLAAKEHFYMVHLPMEAQSYSAEEPDTLRINNSQQEVSSRIKEIKKLFPKVKYINNHTGSKYTADEHAMNRLILAMNSNDISFVDSRTTSETQVPKVMKNFALKYVARDVFLDHHIEKDYVKKQIKEAIRIAKSEGMAIAIGHPHKNTIAALRESKSLFREIDLVLINKVY